MKYKKVQKRIKKRQNNFLNFKKVKQNNKIENTKKNKETHKIEKRTKRKLKKKEKRIFKTNKVTK